MKCTFLPYFVFLDSDATVSWPCLYVRCPFTLLRLVHSHTSPERRTTRELGRISTRFRRLSKGMPVITRITFGRDDVCSTVNLSSFLSASERHVTTVELLGVYCNVTNYQKRRLTLPPRRLTFFELSRGRIDERFLNLLPLQSARVFRTIKV